MTTNFIRIAMGIWETVTDLIEAAMPWSEAEAEAPAEEPQIQV